ncbi:MAG: UvrB/uvrC motif protein [candidate division BRC1 bacterium ADurb.BinA364]|nr:MAG: UvrB/uvrC motif protein [candidate division BRC1 bacterium ADurb.BinA364]
MGEIRGEPIDRDSETTAPIEEAIADEPPPQPSIKALRDRLNRAVESEDFDLAAALRDRIRELEKSEKT